MIIFMSACEKNWGLENNLEEQLEESQIEITNLKQKISKLDIENKNFNRRIGELSAKDPNGLKIEEQRKALSEKEANLNVKEEDLSKREVTISKREQSIRKEEKKILGEHHEFVDTKQDDLEAIGEANEMRRNYRKLEKERSEAENRANNWLIWFSILGLIVFISIIRVVMLSMKVKEKGRQIVSTIDMLNSINLSNENKKLLTNSLGEHN